MRMSKGNNDQDESPIRFHIPSLGRGARTPIPLNQPHWRYAKTGTSMPRWFDWIVMIVMLILPLSLLAFAILDSTFSLPKFLLGLTLTIVTAWALGRMIVQARKQKLEHKNDGQEESPKKGRRPRRRKDYR
jgi:hypothetical protein